MNQPDGEQTGTENIGGIPSIQLQSLRRQARGELRQACKQMNARGLCYGSRWSAELLSQIDLTVESTSTSAVTSAMQSRLASTRKSTGTGGHHGAGGAVLMMHSRMSGGSSGTLAPPIFDEHQGGNNTTMKGGRQSLGHFPQLATPLPAIQHNPTYHPQTHMQEDVEMGHDTPPKRVGSPPTRLSGLHQSHTAFSAFSAQSSYLLPSALSPSPEPWDSLLYAKSLFDLKEFARCAHVLKDIPLLDTSPAAGYDDSEASTPESLQRESSVNGNANIVLFLRCYALYLQGEKRKEEEILEASSSSSNSGGVTGPHGGANGSNGSNPNGSNPGQDPGDSGKNIVNKELRGLQAILSTVLKRDQQTVDERTGLPLGNTTPSRQDSASATNPYARFHADGHLWFLYGLVLRDLGLRSSARHALMLSVTFFPWNHSAWIVLGEFQKTKEELQLTMVWLARRLEEVREQEQRRWNEQDTTMQNRYSLPLQPPGVYMKEFFYSSILIQMQSSEGCDESLSVLEQLCALFPDSMTVRASSAMAYYNQRRFDESQHLFELLYELDPFRWEQMDTYSNILYVKDDRTKLSLLAHQAWKVDKYRLQTCCIIGNYYSSRGERERAILFFKRALKLNPSYLSAWTLMGHEYVELRQTNMAIESYRHAIDINPLDYRAWYGLGQTYEILGMNLYAIYYFKKACEIKPYDPRMWCAMGENYEKLASASQNASHGATSVSKQSSKLLSDAIHCYLRAESNDDVEGVALNKLASLERRRGQLEQAAGYYMKVLQRHGADIISPAAAAIGGSDMLNTSTATIGTHHTPGVLDRPASSQLAHGLGQTDGSGNTATTAAAPLSLHPDAIDAMLFLADFFFHHRQELEQAEAYCNRLLDVGGPSKEAAKSLLLAIRQHKAHLSAASASKRIALAPFSAAGARPSPGGTSAMQHQSSTASSFLPHHQHRTPMRPPPSNATLNASVESSSDFFASPQ